MSFLQQPITLQSLFGEDRTFGEITVDVVINETTNDSLVITKQPVQTGTPITDHAYKEPTVLSMRIRFNDNIGTSLSDIYESLVALQYPPIPIDVVTPKRVYTDMLIQSLGNTTDKYTENVLAIDITFQQIILVDIAPVQVAPLKQQKLPKKTAGILASGKKSILKKTAGLAR